MKLFLVIEIINDVPTVRAFSTDEKQEAYFTQLVSDYGVEVTDEAFEDNHRGIDLEDVSIKLVEIDLE